MAFVKKHDFSQAVKPDEATGDIEVRGYTVKQLTVEELVKSMETAFDAAAKRIGAKNSAGHDGLALLGNAVFLLRTMYDMALECENGDEKRS